MKVGAANQRACIFCGAAADSKEHIIAKRLLNRMERRDYEFRVAHFSELTGLNSRPKTTGKYFTTRHVCIGCNTGWMNNMEAWFETKLGFLIEPQWQPWSELICHSLRDESEALLRWMAKTALMFERAVPQPSTPAVPESVRAMVMNSKFTDDFSVVIARIEESQLDARLQKGLPTWNGNRLHAHQISKEGFCFAVQFNHLAISLMKCPSAVITIKASLVTPDRRHAVPFWVHPRPKAGYPVSVSHNFPDFRSFFDTIEVNADAHRHRNE